MANQRLSQTFAELQANINAVDDSKSKGGANQPVYSDSTGASVPTAHSVAADVPADLNEQLATIPTKVSDLDNDSQFIDNAVNDLMNYYRKSETYTKEEVDAIAGSIKPFEIRLVDELPTASAETMNIIFLVPGTREPAGNTKDEYITIKENNIYKWDLIGSTAIDISQIPVAPGTGTRSMIQRDSSNTATGVYSGALGYQTHAQNTGEFAVGQQNVSRTGDSSQSTIFSVGIGSNTNGLEVRQNGDAYVQNNLYVHGVGNNKRMVLDESSPNNVALMANANRSGFMSAVAFNQLLVPGIQLGFHREAREGGKTMFLHTHIPLDIDNITVRLARKGVSKSRQKSTGFKVRSSGWRVYDGLQSAPGDSRGLDYMALRLEREDLDRGFVYRVRINSTEELRRFKALSPKNLMKWYGEIDIDRAFVFTGRGRKEILPALDEYDYHIRGMKMALVLDFNGGQRIFLPFSVKLEVEKWEVGTEFPGWDEIARFTL